MNITQGAFAEAHRPAEDPAAREIAWWQRAVVYQIYPRSFADGNGDGVGDLPGITARLDHLAWLGVNAVWLSPFYRSPMADGGYDVADHRDVDPLFGDLAAFDALLAGAHQRGLRVLVDFVPNHTSSAHPWFRRSRSSRDDPQRDWYIWRDGRPDGTPSGAPPNNWVSAFGGPAWSYDAASAQWYLRTFLPEQPDLNWRNPAVEAAMFDVVRFWLDRGVDGVRVDVANFVLKDPELRDNPPRDPATATAYRAVGAYDTQIHLHDKGHPDTHGVYRRLRRLLDSYGSPGSSEIPGERVALAELHTFDWPDWLPAWAAYYGEQLDELHLPLNLTLVGLPFRAGAWRSAVDEVERALPAGAWPTVVIGSHDEPRAASRLGAPAARIAMTALLTLRGTPIVYYGDEIAMTDVPLTTGQGQDRWGEQGSPDSALPTLSRDPQRTPMQWSSAPNAGFTCPEADPWLPLAANYEDVNVAVQRERPASMLALTQALLTLRRALPALAIGSYHAVDDAPEDVFAFLRTHGTQRLFIALNFAEEERAVVLPTDPTGAPEQGQLLLCTHRPRAPSRPVDTHLRLGPHEAQIVRLPAAS